MARALEREARAVAASKRAIENHQLALADAQLQALSLRMLLGVEGMAEPIRARAQGARGVGARVRAQPGRRRARALAAALHAGAARRAARRLPQAGRGVGALGA